MTTKTYKNVQLTHPWKLLFLLASSVGLFFLTLFFLKPLELGIIGGVLALVTAVCYFYILKKRLIQVIDLGLSNREILLGSRSIALANIEYYKTHRMKGAALKLKLTNGKILRLSSNLNFSDVSEFVRFVNDFEIEVIKHNQIKKTKSFGQTKIGLFFAILLTLIFMGALIFSTITDEGHDFSKIAMMMIALSTFWSGIEIRKWLSRKKSV